MIASLDAQAISLSAAFVAGLVGSTHCFAMCGGLAGALGMRTRMHGASTAFAHSLVTQLGRIGSYSLAGALASSVGATLQFVFDLAQVAQTMRVLAGLLLIAIAIRVAFAWNLFAWLERAGARLWARVAPFTRRAAGATHIGASLLLGVAWGWLPCGLVYSMLLYAAFAGRVAHGATIMLAFGLGTLPAMLGSGLLAGKVARMFTQRSTRWVAAGMLASFGVLTIVAVFPAQHHH
jgi:sulfite exporter TauE/SafE